MAKNVADNVESLDMYIYTITNGNSIIKKRYVENRSGQMVLRVDEHDYCDRIKIKRLQGITNNKFTSYSLTGTISKIDAIIISDYCKGFLEESDIEHICKYNKNVFVDTKKKLGEWIKDADFIKIKAAFLPEGISTVSLKAIWLYSIAEVPENNRLPMERTIWFVNLLIL